jgi:hypothetical protein
MELHYNYIFDTNIDGVYRLSITDLFNNIYVIVTCTHEFECVWDQTSFINPIGRVVKQSNFINWCKILIRTMIQKHKYEKGLIIRTTVIETARHEELYPPVRTLERLSPAEKMIVGNLPI